MSCDEMYRKKAKIIKIGECMLKLVNFGHFFETRCVSVTVKLCCSRSNHVAAVQHYLTQHMSTKSVKLGL